ncbi:MAG: PEGA domain-containing protein [Rhodothermales bacterium]|nr:PEGA domain-containing protein [Rhodothermales bacterium]
MIRSLREQVSLKRFAQGFTLLLAVVAAVINFWGVISSSTDASSNDRFLSIETAPADAVVIVDGREAGRTPIERFAVPGSELEKPVQIRKEGFVEIDTVLGFGVRHVFTLAPVPGDGPEDGASIASDTEGNDDDPDATAQTPVASPPRRGTLNVSVVPRGDIYVNGTRIDPTAPVVLSAGRHQIRVSHPIYGDLTRSVTITAGGTTDITCHLEADVNVASQPWGTILINGETTEHVTPNVLQLGPGTYEIGIRKLGWTAEQLEGPVGPITIEGSCDERPSYRLVFRLTQQ